MKSIQLIKRTAHQKNTINYDQEPLLLSGFLLFNVIVSFL
jgi:hypothetical protein